MVLERSDALKLLALTFGLAAVMLYLISAIFCYGQDVSCQIQAIRRFLFDSLGGLVLGAFILIVVMVVFLSVKPKAESKDHA